jgi:hypothetical protein
MASGPVFMFCVPALVFDGAECVGSRFHVLRTQTHFRRYGGRRVSISCFAFPDSFSAVPRTFVPFLMFCALGLVFGGTEGVGSRFRVLRAKTNFRHYRRVLFSCMRSRAHFLLYRGRRVPFSCLALPDSFSTLLRASAPVFMFCAPGRVFGGTEGVGSRFHVLRARTNFQRYRGRPVPFSCFALPDIF